MNRRIACSLSLIAAVFVAAACGGGSDKSAIGTNVDPLVCVATPPPTKPTAACEVSIELPPLQANPSTHVQEGTNLTYCSNPPSSGTHYPIWAQFQEYANPIPAPYLVHSLEHGAVILYWKCPPPPDASPATCTPPADVIAALRKVREDTPTDPACDPSTRVRIIIVPSTTIDTPVAAAAWGATYHAACADIPTLEAFVHDHYAHGPEDFCVPGEVF